MSGEKLPEGWVQAVLGDYLYLKNGFAFKSTEYVNPGDHSYPVIRISDLDGTCATDSSAVHVLQGAEGFTIEKGDLLIAMSGATTGKIGIYAGNIPAYQNQRVGNIKLCSSKYGDEKYRNYLITSASKKILDEAYGGAQPNISGKSIEALSFHLAPLAEQKIIAKKLDTLLAQVDNTKARLEQIPQILKRFRQAVLASALKGELTSKWRIANKTGQDISSFKDSVKKYRFENWVKEQEKKFLNKGKQPKNDSWKKKYQEAIISQDITGKEIPDGWLFEPLDGLVYISARIGWKGLKASEYTVKGPLFLSVHSLNYGKEVNLAQAYHISERRYNESPEIMLKNDDVLLCKDGAGIGKLAIVKNLNEPATINSSLLLIRAGDFFIPEYLFYFLSGPDMQNLVKERMTGSAVPHLFQRDVKEFVLEVPPLKEQHEIVRRVEQLFAYADTIEKQVNSALTRVNSLTQSILAKAFRGELTAQWRAENPDLISGENSAAALLEKIKAERATSGGKKTSRKKA
ncbi:restriction endonuclease subunit S [Klebsiella quasivariicola]|uniref:restriction endonuclease subunit S n=1 Tax=Klebsiella quasivariicola TaxID=2026240 RepID=UPI0024790010|nr:restriction endonuclease subunit S [Klebsiella quasivariicola]